jgi:nuclease S1
MKTIRRFCFIALCSWVPILSFAWGVTGHRVVGEIAYRHLTPAARQKVQAILGNTSIAISANWADFVRSDPKFSYLTPWHYINFTDGLTQDQLYTLLRADTGTDVYTKIQFTIRQLKNENLPKDEQAIYLKMLIHMVGDVHQPMHAGRSADYGGNKIGIIWMKDTTNLHRVWDDDLINFQQLSYTEYTEMIDHVTTDQRQQWDKAPIEQWVFESYTISQQLYSEIKDNYQKLSYKYNFDHIDTLNERLLKAGIRLAGVLNEIFDKK